MIPLTPRRRAAFVAAFLSEKAKQVAASLSHGPGPAHAPKGGVTVQGKFYPGGEFIPGSVMSQATPAEKAAVAGETQAHPPAAPEPPDPHQAFADGYYHHDSAEERVGHFLDHFHPFFAEGDVLDFGRLDPDTQSAVAEDLHHWSTDPDDYAHGLAHLLGEKGMDADDSETRMWRAALEGKAVKPGPFDPTAVDAKGYRGDYQLFDLRGVEPAEMANHLAFVRAHGIVPAKLADDVYLVAPGGKAVSLPDGFAAEHVGDATDGTDGTRALFEACVSPPTVGEHEAPASSRDTGTVSGGKAVESSWDPDDVDVYKRLDKDWYVVRHGRSSPEAAGKGYRYDFVHRTKAPVQVRLPQQYWEGWDLDAEPDDIDDDGAERRAAKDSGAAAGERSRIDAARAEYADRRRDHGELRKYHNELTGRQAAAQAMYEKIHEWYEEHAGDTTPPSDESDHGAAVEAFGEALYALHEHAESDGPSEPPDFGLELEAPHKDYRVGFNPDGSRTLLTGFDTRDEEADHLESAVSDYDAARDDQHDALREHDEALTEHLAAYPALWKAVEEAARRVVDTGKDSDDPDYRRNAEIAAKALTLAAKFRRKWKKKDFPGAAELSHGVRGPHPLDAVGRAVLESLGLPVSLGWDPAKHPKATDGRWAPKGGPLAPPGHGVPARHRRRVVKAVKAVAAKAKGLAKEALIHAALTGWTPDKVIGTADEWAVYFATEHCDALAKHLDVDFQTAHALLVHVLAHAVRAVRRHWPRKTTPTGKAAGRP